MRKTIKRAVVVFLVALPLVLLAIAATGDVAAGKTVFTNRCKMCHGVDGTGNPAMARMLKVEFHALDSDYIRDKEDAELKQTVTKGKGKMAAVRGLTDQQLIDVIAYVRSLRGE